LALIARLLGEMSDPQMGHVRLRAVAHPRRAGRTRARRRHGAGGAFLAGGGVDLRIKHDPERLRYTDFAMAAVADDEAEARALFRTAAAQAYLTQEHRLAKIRQGQVA
jgi:hypothetical protein